MKIPEIIFIDSGPVSTLAHLVSETKGTLNDGDTLIFNNDIWQGYIKQIEPETGFYMQIWDCSLLTPLLLKHNTPNEAAPACNIIYTLTHGTFTFKQLKQHLNIDPRANTFFTTNFTEAHFELIPHNNLKAIFISMTSEWMLKQFQDSESHITKFILSLNNKEKPLSVFETASINEYLLVNEIFDHIKNEQKDDLFILSRILLLISQFIDKVFIHKQAGIADNSTQYFEKLKKAEQIISSYIEGKLPPIKEIADMVEMNEATLKRYFKQSYSKTIYEYYLNKKMDLAKRMLIEKTLNVNEVALHLGYEKTTNFIDIFKKHFGYLPGSIRKSH
ncbi:MAG TPA: AraC family transcriptional regulator [Chitinophagaceae bacterium]|jgi:AraC-like DNA-binding protein|nr:AraC family transcriptional regulator [Chitinophagaceae bacterium]